MSESLKELLNKWLSFKGPTGGPGPLYDAGYLEAVKHCATALENLPKYAATVEIVPGVTRSKWVVLVEDL